MDKGLSSDIGQIIGYAYIGIIIFTIISYGIILSSQLPSKGTLMTVSQLIIFTQLCRYSNIINLTTSEFFTTTWKSFLQSQNPYIFLSCPISNARWKVIGIDSFNFICNSIYHLIAISALFLVWVMICLLGKKPISEPKKDFWVLVIYSSAGDLIFYGFLEIQNMSFSSVLEQIGLILACVYLGIIGLIFTLQLCHLRSKKNSFLARPLNEEFAETGKYYKLLFYPFLLFRTAVYMCLLVFSQDIKLLAPIIVSCINLFIFAYVIFLKVLERRNTLFICAVLLIEIFYLYIPVIYDNKLIPADITDIISIILFAVGILIFPLKTYFDSKAVKEDKKITAFDNITNTQYIGDPDKSIEHPEIVHQTDFSKARRSGEGNKGQDLKNSIGLEMPKKSEKLTFNYASNHDDRRADKSRIETLDKDLDFVDNGQIPTLKPIRYSGVAKVTPVLESRADPRHEISSKKVNLNHYTVKRKI